MSSADLTLLVVTVLIFCAVGILSFAFTAGYTQRDRTRQRFGAVSAVAASSVGDDAPLSQRLRRLDPGRLGLDPAAQRKLRGELIRAGFFSPSGVAVFTFVRISLLFLLPLLGYIFLNGAASDWNTVPKLGVAGLLFVVAFYLPRAYLSRSQRLLQDKYRTTFPDFLDMLVVCINAGLSLDAALDRVARELGSDDTELRANLDLMAGEMRAGKSTIEALKDCAERLGLQEARSLATLLQQSIELGTDIALALTTFADEMRDQRMARAEERAASLPPKLTLPLGAFIFPVVLIVVLTPAVLKVLKAVAQ